MKVLRGLYQFVEVASIGGGAAAAAVFAAMTALLMLERVPGVDPDTSYWIVWGTFLTASYSWFLYMGLAFVAGLALTRKWGILAALGGVFLVMRMVAQNIHERLSMILELPPFFGLPAPLYVIGIALAAIVVVVQVVRRLQQRSDCAIATMAATP